MYLFDKEYLKASIKGCAQKCLENLYELMPKLNFERASTLVTRLNTLNDKLKQFPNNVDDFVQFMRDLNTTVAA